MAEPAKTLWRRLCYTGETTDEPTEIPQAMSTIVGKTAMQALHLFHTLVYSALGSELVLLPHHAKYILFNGLKWPPENLPSGTTCFALALRNSAPANAAIRKYSRLGDLGRMQQRNQSERDLPGNVGDNYYLDCPRIHPAAVAHPSG